MPQNHDDNSHSKSPQFFVPLPFMCSLCGWLRGRCDRRDGGDRSWAKATFTYQKKFGIPREFCMQSSRWCFRNSTARNSFVIWILNNENDTTTTMELKEEIRNEEARAAQFYSSRIISRRSRWIILWIGHWEIVINPLRMRIEWSGKG